MSQCGTNSSFYLTLIKEMKMGSSLMRQSLARVLGVIEYDSHPASLSVAITCLLDVATSVSALIAISSQRRYLINLRPNPLSKCEEVVISLCRLSWRMFCPI